MGAGNESWNLERIAKALEKIAGEYCEEKTPKILEKKPVSRIDFIRSMSNPQFASLISQQVQCDNCPILKTHCMLGSSCKDSWQKFLESELVNPKDIFENKKED